MTRTFMAVIAAILSAMLATSCADEVDPHGAGARPREAESFLGRQVARAVAEAKGKLKTENIRIGSGPSIIVNGYSYRAGGDTSGLPKAEITPEGTLLIGGHAIPATPGQRELLLDYRGHVVSLAQAGISLGAQGADIAGAALGGIGDVLFGGPEGRAAYEARFVAEAEKIKRDALRLCALLPGMYESQHSLAATLPAFAPYATMSREGVVECGKDAGHQMAAAATAT